jgi:hypothetical protein
MVDGVRQGQGDPAPDQVLAEAIIWHELKLDKILINQLAIEVVSLKRTGLVIEFVIW